MNFGADHYHCGEMRDTSSNVLKRYFDEGAQERPI
jgi:hypothetical protein